jgi:hypothetical protein
MKRRITVDDLNQLSEQQKQKLREWWKPSFGDCFMQDGETDIDILHYYDGWAGKNLAYKSDPPRDWEESDKAECIPLPDIGMMIELLKSTTYWQEDCDMGGFFRTGGWELIICWKGDTKRKELCDALFEAVKEVL